MTGGSGSCARRKFHLTRGRGAQAVGGGCLLLIKGLEPEFAEWVGKIREEKAEQQGSMWGVVWFSASHFSLQACAAPLVALLVIFFVFVAGVRVHGHCFRAHPQHFQDFNVVHFVNLVEVWWRGRKGGQGQESLLRKIFQRGKKYRHPPLTASASAPPPASARARRALPACACRNLLISLRSVRLRALRPVRLGREKQARYQAFPFWG